MSLCGSEYSVYYDAADSLEDYGIYYGQNQDSFVATTEQLAKAEEQVEQSIVVQPRNGECYHENPINTSVVSGRVEDTKTNQVVDDVLNATKELKSFLMNVLPESTPDFRCKAMGVHEKSHLPVYTQILLAGANAKDVLKRTLEEMSHEKHDSTPFVYTVPKEAIATLGGFCEPVATLIKQTLPDSTHKQDCILVLDSLKLDDILYLHKTEFISKTLLQIQPRLAFIIFVNPIMNSFSHFQEIGAKIIVTGPEKVPEVLYEPLNIRRSEIEKECPNDDGDSDESTSICGQREDNCTPDTTVFGEHSTPALSSLRSASALSEKTCQTAYLVSCDTSYEILITGQQPEGFVEVGGAYDTKITGPMASLESVVETKNDNLEESWISRAIHSAYDFIAQCGDCCFY